MREDDRQRQREKEHYERLSFAEERKTGSDFLLKEKEKEKEKKRTFLGTWSQRKKEKIHVWTLVLLEGRRSDFSPWFVSVAVGERLFIIF